MSSSSNVIVHIVESDEDPRAICNGEPFELSDVSGSGVLELCPQCETIMHADNIIEGEVINDVRN